MSSLGEVAEGKTLDTEASSDALRNPLGLKLLICLHCVAAVLSPQGSVTYVNKENLVFIFYETSGSQSFKFNGIRKKKILFPTHEKENLRFGRIQDCGAENQKFHN